MENSAKPTDLAARMTQALSGLISDPQLQAGLGRYGHPRLLRPGQSLCSQGELVEYLWLVLEGRLNRLKYRSDDSLGPLPGLGPGDWCGLAEYLADSNWLAETLADDHCLVLGFNRLNFRSLGTACPQFQHTIVPQKLARELVLLHSQLSDSGPLDRIVSFLLSKRRQLGGVVNQSVSISQADLARAVGCTRETVNKHLGLLERRGLLGLERRCIVIPDWEALSRYH